MYAVIKTGGKQYTVREGDTFRVEKLVGDAGAAVELKEVVAVGEGDSIKVGTPFVASSSVTCEIVGHGKEKKVDVFKKRRRKGYTKKIGHRQHYTTVMVKAIKA
ncbi:MAG: 50S ribosomal protein L21 [Deltaproteobacteria bacterium]|nr:50S ribosomal protein L21 [Deltaproteobacteria bacterium]